MAEFILHRRQARKFYDLMNQNVDNSVTICFDVMENLVLPKTRIGAAYYSRQLYLYVFGVVRHRGPNIPQTKDDVIFNIWLESQAHKDSNTIASALKHAFSHFSGELQHAQVLRLFSDSCYRHKQKCQCLVPAACRPKLHASPHHQLHVSCQRPYFLPVDRASGRLEKDYSINILLQHGTVFQCG
ncbi:hypothetical protein PoB_001538400 [Plakobranchus ocellatus]|uniref:Uncharacterized protein n=1 Tax=Plakobranchus ocellatus TaxID=259542 RepID=A0AAV3Z3A3_9GAST|nr:hypothetical protein PoB_001538400 [Plakobranchus ocellatus]